MRLPSSWEIKGFEREQNRRPIVCCECGKECLEYGEIYAKEMGW